jgi:hypothetical protein
MIVMTAAFFVLCVAYVGLCDRIIGADPIEMEEAEPEANDEWEAAA